MIGAGSVVFVKNLLTDILSLPELGAARSRCTTSTRSGWRPPA